MCGLVCNCFNYPIFLNIDFLYGSIFAMLALQYFGLSVNGDKERFLGHGFDGYLSKPLETMELICEMKRVMGITGESTNSELEAVHG